MLTRLAVVAAALTLVALPAPSAHAEPEPPLTFASFNVCKVGCGDAQGLPWDVRRDRVGRVITESGADVVGLQEATNNGTAWAKTQVEDIAGLIAPAGYALAQFPDSANACKRRAMRMVNSPARRRARTLPHCSTGPQQ